jgi:hypothetical protein
MKKAILYTLIGGVFCVGSTPTVHAEAPATTLLPIIISEIQTAGTTDATEEFVELFNPNTDDIDITGWLLQYRPASGTASQSWTSSSTKATLACPDGAAPDCRVVIPAKNRIAVTHTIANIASALSMTGGFSSAGGQIRLVQPGTPIVHDFVGYGTATHAETSPATAPAAGKSMKRVVDSQGHPIDTDNNALDFIAACGEPTPGQEDTSYIPQVDGCSAPPDATPDPVPDPPITDPIPQPDEPPVEDPGQGSVPVYLPVVITEVFADPTPPQQDSTDEFIEIYNPNDSAITLKGYRLQTGSDFRYTYTLGDTPLGPRMYLAIPSAVSKLSLANSGSGVRLIDPNGAIAYEAPHYGDAKEGQAWMQDDTGWKWSLTPTPGSANTLTLPPPKVLTLATPQKKKAAKTASAKVTAPKQTKAPATKKATEQPKNTTLQAATTAANPQYWLLIPLGTLAAGYAAYEYRHDISRASRNAWAKIRGKEPSSGE